MIDPIDKLVYDRAMLVPRGMDGTSARKTLQAIREALGAVTEDAFDAGNLSNVINAQIAAIQVNPDALHGALRVAITGSTQPADIYQAMELLGKDRTIGRLQHAIRELMVVA